MTYRSVLLVVALLVAPRAVAACSLNDLQCFFRGANASITTRGCFNVGALGLTLDVTSSINGSHQLNASTCAAACLGVDAVNVSAFPVRGHFTVAAGRCLCFRNASADAGATDAAQCDVGAPVYAAQLACPLNVTNCGAVTGCEVREGCCLRADAPPGLPAYYSWMFRWVLIIVIVLAVLEAIVYGCVRIRHRDRWQDADAGALDAPAQLRDAADAKALSSRLLETLPPGDPRPLLATTDAADMHNCVICLDEFDGLPTVRLPCNHVLHAHCMADLMGHQLQRTSTVLCPMCRAPVIADIALP